MSSIPSIAYSNNAPLEEGSCRVEILDPLPVEVRYAVVHQHSTSAAGVFAEGLPADGNATDVLIHRRGEEATLHTPGIAFRHLPPKSARISYAVQCCITSTETIQTTRDGGPRTATSTFTQLLSSDTSSSVLLFVHRDLRTIRDGEPRTATSTFTQLLNSVSYTTEGLLDLYLRVAVHRRWPRAPKGLGTN